MRDELWTNEYMAFYNDGELGVSDGVGFIANMSIDDTKKLYLVMKNFFETIVQQSLSGSQGSPKSCDFCADESEAENNICSPCLDRLIREGA